MVKVSGLPQPVPMRAPFQPCCSRASAWLVAGGVQWLTAGAGVVHSERAQALVEDISRGIIPSRAVISLEVLIKGYAAGVVLA